MTDRILLSSSSLKVSRTGINVFSATNEQLLFDSSKGPVMGIHATGVMSPNSSVIFPTLPYVPYAIVSSNNGPNGGWVTGGWITANATSPSAYQVGGEFEVTPESLLYNGTGSIIRYVIFNVGFNL